MIDTEHEDTVVKTFVLFVQSARTILKYIDADLYRKARLSIIKLTALQVLNSRDGVVTPSEIAELTQTERHNITALVDRMKKEGLVTTERNSSNKRYVNIFLTDKGRNLLDQAAPVADEVANRVMSSISKNDAAQLEKLLEVLGQNAKTSFDELSMNALS